MELSGIAIITGAASGIGRGIALRFADFGCKKFMLVDINGDELKETKYLLNQKSPPAEVLLNDCNLTADGVAEKIVQRAINHFGRVDYLVNCAGTPGGFYSSVETSLEVFDAVQRLNVRATWCLQRATVEQMLKQDLLDGERGSIVNIGSTVSHVAQPKLSAYVTSKHAVLGMTKSEAIDSAASGIRVNCVAPAFVETNLGRAIPQEVRDKYLTPVVQLTPLGRPGTTTEVANAVVFLSSKMASYITGISLAVDGGYTAA